MKRPEILAPAGDFSTAIRAFEAGADAVYLGLKDFSARKGATNFDFSELRRLKSYTRRYHKSFYVTLNTLIEDGEFEKIHGTLSELALIRPTALIIQDLGLASFIKKEFPELVLHASTQMAIHNSSGVKMAKELGISRVVLSRELSFEQISLLRKEHPNMEFEIFIHGALCYSFSGLCLASGLLLNRSGNRGLCAQLCRNFYRQGEKEYYPFSCNDLALNEKVLELAKIGIDSFKIEGRLKSKEYVQNTARFYRSLLEGKEAYSYQKEAKLSFAREQSLAYFDSTISSNLIGPVFPGHRGLYLGSIEKTEGLLFTLSPLEPLERNDTLLILDTEGKFARFTAFQVRKVKNKVEILFEDKEGSSFKPKTQDAVYLIHRASQLRASDVDYKTISEEKKSLPLEIQFLSDRVIFSSPFFQVEEALPLAEAKSDKNYQDIFKDLFKEASTSRFTFSPLNFKNESPYKNIFIPLSLLKKTKNALYEKADLGFEDSIQQKWKAMSFPSLPSSLGLDFFEKRKNLSPSELPFALEKDLHSLDGFKSFEDKIIIPLLPVLRDERVYFDSLKQLLENYPEKKFLLGLNNLAHLSWVKEWAGNEKISFFGDFYLYVANSFSYELLSMKIPRLLFAYDWVERISGLPGLLKMKDASELPYFISLGCFERFNHFKGVCPSSCPKSYDHTVKNGAHSYKVVVRDCLSFLFKN